MVTAVETQDVQKARSISTRVDEVARDVDLQRNSQNQRLLQACVMECTALAQQWRASVKYFEATIAETHQTFDYRNLRDVLLPAAQKTKSIYQDVAKIAQSASVAMDDQNDLQFAITEIEHAINWFEDWPMNDPTRRNAARAAIATENSLSDEELAALLST